MNKVSIKFNYYFHYILFKFKNILIKYVNIKKYSLYCYIKVSKIIVFIIRISKNF